jgi:hypothetical protein
MRRREFIAGLGGAVVWPLAVRAQQGERMRRIGVLMSVEENDAVAKTLVSAFTQGLAGLLDHIVVFGEAHLRRILRCYARYYTTSERIDHWIKMRRSLVQFSGPGASNRCPS